MARQSGHWSSKTVVILRDSGRNCEIQTTVILKNPPISCQTFSLCLGFKSLPSSSQKLPLTEDSESCCDQPFLQLLTKDNCHNFHPQGFQSQIIVTTLQLQISSHLTIDIKIWKLRQVTAGSTLPVSNRVKLSREVTGKP